MSWRVSVQARLLVGGVLISIVAGLLLGTQSCWAVEALLGKRTSASLETMQLVRDEHTLVAEMIKAQMAARGGGLEPSLSDRNPGNARQVSAGLSLARWPRWFGWVCYQRRHVPARQNATRASWHQG